MTDQRREVIAAVQHEIWAHWMRHMFSHCRAYSADGNYPGCLMIPAGKVERWKRQVSATYSDLPSREQDSDREQADKVIAAIEESDRQEKEELLFALESTQTPFEEVAPQPGVIQIYRSGDIWVASVCDEAKSSYTASGSTAVEALTNLKTLTNLQKGAA